MHSVTTHKELFSDMPASHQSEGELTAIFTPEREGKMEKYQGIKHKSRTVENIFHWRDMSKFHQMEIALICSLTTLSSLNIDDFLSKFLTARPF